MNFRNTTCAKQRTDEPNKSKSTNIEIFNQLTSNEIDRSITKS